MNREEEIKAANPYGNSSSFASGKMIGFTIGAEWADAHPKNPWISVKEQLPEENENIIIMCKHGAIFNGTYCNGAWFCMDGYINDSIAVICTSIEGLGNYETKIINLKRQ